MRQYKDIYPGFKAALVLGKPKISYVAVCWPLVNVQTQPKLQESV